MKWKQGIPLNNPPGAKGLKLVFADDFDGAMSISMMDGMHVIAHINLGLAILAVGLLLM